MILYGQRRKQQAKNGNPQFLSVQVVKACPHAEITTNPFFVCFLFFIIIELKFASSQNICDFVH